MADHPAPVRVLFVCTGNICRSPMAEGAFSAMVAACGLSRRIETGSAGTIAYHAGEAPDERARDIAAARGFGISSQRARQVTQDDFADFDLIVALDRTHLKTLNDRRPPGAAAGLRLLLDFAPQVPDDDVPDPYYGGIAEFQAALDLIEAGCAGLLDDIRRGLQDAARGLRGAGPSSRT